MSIDEDQRDARGPVGIAHDQIGEDGVVLVAHDCLVAERVGPEPSHERHLRAQPRRGHGLVGPLAAGRHHAGEATYRTTLVLPKSVVEARSPLALDPGAVKEIAPVRLVRPEPAP